MQLSSNPPCGKPSALLNELYLRNNKLMMSLNCNGREHPDLGGMPSRHLLVPATQRPRSLVQILYCVFISFTVPSGAVEQSGEVAARFPLDPTTTATAGTHAHAHTREKSEWAGAFEAESSTRRSALVRPRNITTE